MAKTPKLSRFTEEFYQKKFNPSKQTTERYLSFTPSMRYLGKSQGRIIAEAKPGEDPVALQMRNTFFYDLEAGDARRRTIDAINYGSREINAFFREHLGEAVSVLDLQELDENTNLTEMLREAQEKREKTRNGRHGLIGPEGKLLDPAKGRRYDYGALVEAYNAVRAVGIGHHFLKILQSPERRVHSQFHTRLLGWLERVTEVPIENSDLSNLPPQAQDCETFFETHPSTYASGRLKTPLPTFAKTIINGIYLDRIKDTTGARFVVQGVKDCHGLVNFFGSRVKGPSALEDFDKVKERKKPWEDPYYDARFDDGFKFVLRPGISCADTLDEGILGDSRIRLPLEVQIMTGEALGRLNANPGEIPAHKLYKHRKACALFQIINPFELFVPFLIQNPEILRGLNI